MIFDREITEQLQRQGEARLLAEHDMQIQGQSKVLAQIGRSATDYSLYQQNFLSLQRKMPTRK